MKGRQRQRTKPQKVLAPFVMVAGVGFYALRCSSYMEMATSSSRTLLLIDPAPSEQELPIVLTQQHTEILRKEEESFLPAADANTKPLSPDLVSSFFDGEESALHMYLAGPGQKWGRVYAKVNSLIKNETICPNPSERSLPTFANGVAAGPKLCPHERMLPLLDQQDLPFLMNASQCSMEDYSNLDMIASLQRGESVLAKLEDFDPLSMHSNVVFDRKRHSSASGVVFLDKSHFVVVSFGLSKVYLYRFDIQRQEIEMLDSIVNKMPGGLYNNQKGIYGEFSELVDFDGKELLAVSNLGSASQSIIKVDMQAKKLTYVQSVKPFEGLGQNCHGTRFYPTDEGSSHILASTAQRKHIPESLMVRFYDWHKNETLADLMMNTTRHAGLGPQDVFFMDKFNLLVVFTPNLVFPTKQPKLRPCRMIIPQVLSSRLVHFRLLFDLDNIVPNKTAVHDRTFLELQSIDLEYTHPDSIGYKNGVVIMSDQFNDQVTFVEVDPTGAANMSFIDALTGYHMNHGVAIAKDTDLLAVSLYGDNSVVVSELPARLKRHFARSQRWVSPV